MPRIRFPAITAQKKRDAVRPLARFRPTHIDAEKKVKPIMITNIDQKPRFCDSATAPSSKSCPGLVCWLEVLICF